MLEVGWSEILVIALVLIIVVGPKELPGMLRTFGKMASRLRSMANEFKGQFDEALREAELDDVRKGIGEVNKLNPSNALRDAINPLRQLGQDIKSDLQKASDISLKPDEPAIAKPGDSVPAETATLQPAEPVVAEPASVIAEPVAAAAIQPQAVMAAETVAKPKTARKHSAAVAKDEPVIAEAAPMKKPARASKLAMAASAEVATPTTKGKAAPKKAAAANELKKAAPRKKAVKTGDA